MHSAVGSVILVCTVLAPLLVSHKALWSMADR